jgi:hypothetical protein
MTTAMTSEIDRNATLEILLPERVTALELHALLGIAQFAYSSAEWLYLAARQPLGVEMPDEEFVPSPESTLRIMRLEIGTPNKLTLSGRLKGIAAVASLLAALIGLPVSGTQAYKNYAEGLKAQAEAAKIIEETEVIKEQRREAERLRREGRISEESLRSKQETPHILGQYFKFAAPLLINQELRVKEQK